MYREGAKVAVAMGAEAHLLAICRSMLAGTVPEGVTPRAISSVIEGMLAIRRP